MLSLVTEDIVMQIKERFHPEDRLMLWLDFFNHDSARYRQHASVHAPGRPTLQEKAS